MSDSEHLVLDACPSPPRIDSLNDDFGEKENTPNEENSEENFKKPKTKRSKKHGNKGPVNFIKIANCHGFQIGPTIVVNPRANENISQRNKEAIIITREIQKLFEDNRQLNRQDLLFVSTHMGKGWEDLARALDYSEGQIYQFHVDFINSGIKEVIYRFLLDWTRVKTQEATIARLTKLLWDCDQKQVVKLLVDGE